jgi:predicted metal-dependent hydrolase
MPNMREELDQAHHYLEDKWLDEQEPDLPHLRYLQGLYNSAVSHYESGQFDRANDFLNSFWRAINV